MHLKRVPFGKTEEGQIYKYTLGSGRGLEVEVINFGGIITSIRLPDKRGRISDIALGFDSLKDYLGEHPSFGEIIGRYGNRIAFGKFCLDGREYQLTTNLGPHTLHGGRRGFGRYRWDVQELTGSERSGIELTRLSPHLEEGFPGNLQVSVKYQVDHKNRLHINYEATTDQPTVLNLTNHTYFNLKGHDQGNILDHEMMINAGQVTAVDDMLIPDGTYIPVEGTPLDFQSPRKVRDGIQADHPLIQLGNGYDHNYVLDRPGLHNLAARVSEATSGRVLEVYTDQPGVQLYTGNWLDGSLPGKGGATYLKHAAFCLETQHFPDSPNHAGFPSTTLRPGQTFRSTTIYACSVQE